MAANTAAMRPPGGRHVSAPNKEGATQHLPMAIVPGQPHAKRGQERKAGGRRRTRGG